MNRGPRLALTVAVVVGALFIAFQLWGPAPSECVDGPCDGWEWGLVSALATVALVLLLVLGTVAYAVRELFRARRRRE
jgi:heme/copper-type cytochrome/quinol oxidase subunit 2